MSSAPLVLLDFDTTLFNTKLFLFGLSQRFAAYVKVSPEEIQQNLQGYFDQLGDRTLFDPATFINQLAVKYQVDEAQLTAIYNRPEFYTKAIFPEVSMVLETLKKQEVTLGIFSQGVKKWQEKKLVESGLINYFDHNHIYIKTNKTAADFLSTFSSRTLVVDDKQEVVEKLRQFSVFVPVWINRFSEEKWPNGPTIFSLTGIMPLIKHLAE